MKTAPLKTRKPLQRKTPLRSKRRPYDHGEPKRRIHAFGGGQRVPKRTMRKKRPKATPAEQAHMNAVTKLGCIVCRHHGITRFAKIHHVRTGYGAAERASHWETLPLCQEHHQDGGFGVAFHGGPRTWMAKFGTEIALLVEVYQRIDVSFETLPELRGSVPPWWHRFLDGSALVSKAAEVFQEEEDEEDR